MKTTWLIALAIGCGNSEGTPPPVTRDAAAPLFVHADAGAAPAPPPAAPAPTYKVAKGDTLAPIARKAYGSEHYASVIEAVNHVSAEKLKIGQELSLPALDGLAARTNPTLGSGIAEWDGAREAAWDARRANRAIAADVQQTIRHAAADVRAGAKALPPGAAATAFGRAADAMEQVTAGTATANGYDVDDVDRRLAEGIAALVR